MNIKSFQVVIYHMTKEESESTISHEIRKPYITVVNNMVAIRTSPCWVAFPLDFFRITCLRCTPYFCCNSSTVNQPWWSALFSKIKSKQPWLNNRQEDNWRTKKNLEKEFGCPLCHKNSSINLACIVSHIWHS